MRACTRIPLILFLCKIWTDASSTCQGPPAAAGSVKDTTVNVAEKGLKGASRTIAAQLLPTRWGTETYVGRASIWLRAAPQVRATADHDRI